MNFKKKMNIILLLNFALISLALCTQCPYEEPSCSCKETAVSCYGLSELPPLRTGPNVTVVDTLIIQSGTIQNFNKSNLPPGLIRIEFYDNPLTNISRDAFQASASTLRVLSFSGASFTKLPDAILELTNPTTLSISKTYIQDWDNVTLEYLASRLLSLTLVKAGLSEWPSWFYLFRSLTYVDFSWNPFDFIPDDAFNSLNDTLESLVLHSIGLKVIPQAMLGLRSLTSLDLSYNNLMSVNGKPSIEQLALFPCAKTLVRLTVVSAGLTAIPNFSFLTNLNLINLEHNEISDSTSGSFSPSVTILLLPSNKLTSVPSVIANMSGLQSLSLSFNYILEIRSHMFPTSLADLNLEANNLTEIREESFANLSSLVTLALMTNPISTISASAFASLPLLKNLLLSGTSLSLIPAALLPLTSLQMLSFSIPSLICPCPVPPELAQWYNSYNETLDIEGSCDPDTTISNYLNGSCSRQPQTTQRITQPTTTNTKDDAPALTYSYLCRYVSLILVLLTYPYRFC